MVGNRIQLFAEEESVNVDPQPNTSNDLGPTLEEAQDLLCYRKTDSARYDWKRNSILLCLNKYYY